MRADATPKAVAHALQELGVQSGETVCCALSGGADSVCLLLCLLASRAALGILVTAVHVNHCLRGRESDRDEAFCRTLCAERHVPLTVCRVDVRATMQEKRCSEELAARLCRYAAFAEISADWIATAHTASDNLETLVHRMTRGASLKGLAAIPPKNGRFLRPMLELTRQQTEDYLAYSGQEFITDSTNHSDKYTRNRIRHHIVPMLRELNPSVERTASHTLRGLRRDADFLEQQARAAYRVCHTAAHTLSGLETLHEALAFRCVAMLLEEAGYAYDAPLLEKLVQLTKHGGRWELTNDVYAVGACGQLRLERIPKPQPQPAPKPLKIGENTLFPGLLFEARVIPADCVKKNENVHENFANSVLDYDKIKGRIFLRPRQPGDRMQPTGKNFTSALKKLVQAGLPPQRRRTAHVLADEAGVIYAEGVGAAQRVAPDAQTKQLLITAVRESSGEETSSQQNGVNEI